MNVIELLTHFMSELQAQGWVVESDNGPQVVLRSGRYVVHLSNQNTGSLDWSGYEYEGEVAEGDSLLGYTGPEVHPHVVLSVQPTGDACEVWKLDFDPADPMSRDRTLVKSGTADEVLAWLVAETVHQVNLSGHWTTAVVPSDEQ